MTDSVTHSVAEVKIDGPEVTVVCTCGWTSNADPDEATAKAAFDVHLTEVSTESN